MFSIFVTYVVVGVGDYIGMRKIANREICDKVFSWPWYGIILMPGAGNACLDKGFYPLKEKNED